MFFHFGLRLLVPNQSTWTHMSEHLKDYLKSFAAFFTQITNFVEWVFLFP